MAWQVRAVGMRVPASAGGVARAGSAENAAGSCKAGHIEGARIGRIGVVEVLRVTEVPWVTPRALVARPRRVCGCAAQSAAPLPPTRALRRHTPGALWDRLADGTVGCVACAR